MNPAPTPRTDAAIQFRNFGSGHIDWVSVKFARTLERELTEARATLLAREGELDSMSAALAAKDAQYRDEMKRLQDDVEALFNERNQLRAEVERLKAEQTQILTDKNYAGGVCYWVTKHDEALLREAKLRAELAAAKEDTERLDWLASQSYYPHDHPKDGVFVVVSENVAPHGAFSLERDRDRKALRAAIDAARSHLPESGKPTP